MKIPLSAATAVPLLLVAVGTIPVAGCSAADDRYVSGGATIGSGSSDIINGTESGPEDDATVGLGVLSVSGHFMGACSGVLIAPNVVLTARHCVSKTQGGGIACAVDGSSLTGGKILKDYEASQIGVFLGSRLKKLAFAAKGKKIFRPPADNLCNNDISVVVLDTAIPDAVIAPIRLDGPPEKDEQILAVGWGVSNNSTGFQRRRRAGIAIQAVGPAGGAGKSGIAAHEFSVGEGICQGDSGGPGFAESTGAVLGVVSRGGNGAPYDPKKDPRYKGCVDKLPYRTHNLYTRVDAFKDLILEAFAEAGTEPWVEGSPDPRKAKLGEPCEAPEACRSNICVPAAIQTDKVKSICSSACDAPDAKCPDGYACKELAGAKVCLPKPPPAPPKKTKPVSDQAPQEATGKSGCAIAKPGESGDLAPLGLFALGGALVALARRRRTTLREGRPAPLTRA